MAATCTQALRTTSLKTLSLTKTTSSSSSIFAQAKVASSRVCRISSQSKRTITTLSKHRNAASVTKLRTEPEEYGYIYESMYEAPHIPEMPVPHGLFEELHKWSHKTAMECGVTGRSYSFGELRDMIWRWGGFLQKTYGENKHPTVAILSPNTIEYPIVYFGTMAAGGTTTTINAAYTPAEIAHHLADSGAEMIVVDGVMEPLADAALQILKKEMPVIVNGVSPKGRPNLQEIVKNANIPFATDVEYDPNRVAVLPYSSGTTGKPKGVEITQRAFLAGCTIYHFPEGINVEKAEGNHQEVLLGLLPFFHIYGMCVFLSSGLSRGAKIVTLPKFDPKTYAATLKQHEISVLHTVPPLMQFIVGSPAITREDLQSIKTVMCGAAPVPPASALALKEKAGSNLCFQEGFGMTETLCTHISPRNGEKLGYCGRLLPTVRAKLVDMDTGVSLPPGSKGELCIKTPGLMAGYHNNPKATKETIDEDGWLHTGDVATCDEEGYFSIVDRIKELIKVKGLQVAPSELEDILLSHPGVAEAGVIGVKDERAGELPRAYVVPRQKDLTEAEIHAFLDEKVARHKKLMGGVRFVSELPKNATGKLLRRQLKILAEEETLRG